MHDLGRLLLGGECFNGEFASNKRNEIGDRVQLQEAVHGQRELVEAGILLPLSVRWVEVLGGRRECGIY